jgi:hypothetical protein
MECKCGKVVVAAASPNIPGSDSNGAAACTCYPANDACPSGVTCDKYLWTTAPEHVELASGMVRSNDAGKPDYTLIDLDLLERWAVHMTVNVESKGRDNWRLGSTEEDLARFKASAWRHFLSVMRGDGDEDHAAALVFNVAGVEKVRASLRNLPG